MDVDLGELVISSPAGQRELIYRAYATRIPGLPAAFHVLVWDVADPSDQDRRVRSGSAVSHRFDATKAGPAPITMAELLDEARELAMEHASSVDDTEHRI